MNIFEDKSIRDRLRQAFPKYFINTAFEIIIYPARNTYFSLGGVATERELIAKILEWLSREACKSHYRQSQKYHLTGINNFLGTKFTEADMYKIYTYLGNCCNHPKTLQFIDSGYDLEILDRRDEPL